MPSSNTATTTMRNVFYQEAANYYLENCDPEYEYCNDNQYRFFLISEYAEWLLDMNQVIRIWE